MTPIIREQWHILRAKLIEAAPELKLEPACERFEGEIERRVPGPDHAAWLAEAAELYLEAEACLAKHDDAAPHRAAFRAASEAKYRAQCLRTALTAFRSSAPSSPTQAPPPPPAPEIAPEAPGGLLEAIRLGLERDRQANVPEKPATMLLSEVRVGMWLRSTGDAKCQDVLVTDVWPMAFLYRPWTDDGRTQWHCQLAVDGRVYWEVVG